ncbi:MAG: hypothetical protein GX303_03900, partial [Clostridiales bacterium]|nr:hypothetical protein [Clostridiales bacterium]
PLVGRRSDDTGRIRLLCAHADLNSPVSRYCPLSVKDLTDFGLDYAALGHVHVTTGIDRSGDTYYGYSGCPEGRSFDEPGVGGAYFVTIQSEEGKRDIKVNRVSFSRRRYETERIDLSGVSLLEEAAARLSARINQKKYGKNTLLRAIFEGVVSPDFGGLERLSEQFDDNLFMLEVIDRTLPIFDGARLSGDMTVRGEIYRYLLPLME